MGVERPSRKGEESAAIIIFESAATGKDVDGKEEREVSSPPPPLSPSQSNRLNPGGSGERAEGRRRRKGLLVGP